jgi:ABC-2 type transport system permease protein
MIGFRTLLRREISRFMKVLVQTILTPFVSSFLYMLVFGVSLGSQVQMKSGVPYLLYLLPGLMMMGLLNNAYQNSSSSIVNMKFTGDLEDLRIVPLSNSQIVWAMSLAALIRGVIVLTVTYLVGSAFLLLGGNPFPFPEHPMLFLFFTIVAGLTFGNMGISIAFWAKTFDQLSAISTFLLLPLTYLGGVFISLEKLQGFWKSAALVNPLLYFIEGLRYGLIGVSDVSPVIAMFVSCFSLLIFHFLAMRALRPGSFSRW